MENNNEKSIQRLIMEISRMYVEKCFGKLKSLGIHPRQMPILAVLWKENGCSQKELASQLGVKPPTVTVSIQRLEKIGIIVRKQDEKDQRISRIYLTEEGKAIINEGMRMAKEGEKQVLNGFSESELCLMKRFCIQIKENIAAMPAPEFSPEEVPEAGWKLEAHTFDLHHNEEMMIGNVMTEYEEKFSSMGNPICKMIIRR